MILSHFFGVSSFDGFFSSYFVLVYGKEIPNHWQHQRQTWRNYEQTNVFFEEIKIEYFKCMTILSLYADETTKKVIYLKFNINSQVEISNALILKINQRLENDIIRVGNV